METLAAAARDGGRPGRGVGRVGDIGHAERDDLDQATAWDHLVAAADATDQGEGVLILVDMFGSTSSTLALSLLADRNVEVLTGVNLAMVLRALLNRKETTLKSLSEDVLNYGRRNVTSSATWLSTGDDKQGIER